MRSRHYLDKNHQTRVPRSMCWVDTEALNEDGKPEAGRQTLFFGCAIYERYSQRDQFHCSYSDRLLFYNASDFWKWIDSKTYKGRSLYIFAHNWNYDGAILNTTNELPKLGWTLKSYINEKPPVIIKWVKGSSTIHMVDTLNYFQNSVAELGRSVGMAKLDMPSGGVHSEEWADYAWRDVEIIRKAVLGLREFIHKHDMGNFQFTSASQAFSAYRHRFMKHKILVHDHEKGLKLERESYHGGRAEAFWKGPATRKMYKLDINSMYPSIMKKYPLGVHFEAYFPFYVDSWWKRVWGSHSIVASCDIETEEDCYPYHLDGKLVFPVGKFTTTLTTPEIEYGLKMGHIVGINEWAYHKREYIFTEWVDYLYTLRKEYKTEGNDVFAYFVKLLMNSCYGKFGQQNKNWEDTHNHYMDDDVSYAYEMDDDGTFHKLRNILGNVQILGKESESRNSVPLIAAEITAYARMYLWEIMKQAGDGNVYYCDTDSVIVNRSGYNNLKDYLDTEELGYLKVEEEATSAIFEAPKDYTFGTTTKIKGVKKNATKIDYNHYIQDRFGSWHVMIVNNEEGYVDVLPTHKHITHLNTKRRVLGNGYTLPIRLPLQD